ncbi:MAG: uroporphyrinogen-III synthase, partial [Prevotella sp.]|nr:uroporphyrinogen-III synthase [Prevotella sp.]MDY2772753.1 uroporphyrinogen-III synthase [Prevotella sp.]
SNDFTEEEAAKFDCNMLVFFSPSGIKAFTKNFPSFEQNDVRIATFGPATAKAVTDAGYRLDLEAPTKEHPSMTSALRYYLENNK